MDFTQSMDNGYMIPSSIAVGSGEATDIRCVCDTVEDFKAFLDTTEMELRYEGLVTYEKVNKRLMVYEGDNVWQVVGEGGGNIDTSSFVTLTQLSQQLNNYYTKTQTDNKILEEIAKVQLGGEGEVDLSAYATKTYVDDEISKIELKEGPQGPQGPKGDTGEVGPQGPAGTVDTSNFYNKAEIDTKDKVLNDKITVLIDKVDYIENNGNIEYQGKNNFNVTDYAYEVINAIKGENGESVVNANASTYLNIPVYNNENDYQATHPSVLYFQDKWNGYKFWMGYTPYESENESIENPCIVASNDGVNWEVPLGLTNPLDLTNNVNTYHNSDTHLVFVNGQLECWYRRRTRGELGNSEIILRCVSVDGVKWTLGEEVIKFEGSYDKKLSPVVLYEDKYKVWFCNFSDNKIEYYEGENALNLVKIRDIEMPSCDGLKVWHMDIKHTCNGYEMYFCAGRTYQCYSMYCANSLDNINYGIATKIMESSTEGFDRMLYRPCIIDVGFDRFMYYGGVNKSDGNKWYIGLTKGKIYSPTVFDGRTVSNADIEGVTLNRDKISITKEEEFKLIATIIPSNAKDKTIIWESSNNSIATVTGDGIVKGVEVGETTISATTARGGFVANCTVIVTENLNLTIKAGDNLFDRNKAIEGGYYKNINGLWVDDSQYYSSEFIEVSPGLELIRDDNSAGLCYWDKDKKFISGLNYNVKVGVVPPNAKYLTFAYFVSQVDLAYLMLNETVENKTPLNVELFDKENVTNGQYIDPNGTLKNDPIYSTSDYIEVGTGITLNSTNILRISAYDSNKNYIGVVANNINDVKYRHCKYIVISFETSKINSVSVQRTV